LLLHRFASRHHQGADLHGAILQDPAGVAQILPEVHKLARRSIEIKRFKGLGEMNPKELFETTMDPARRKLLRIDLTDAVEAEEMFTKLMGEEVEPRRQFIEDNALNVRNLDI
jgi:DNA gyrase subunit B